MAFAARCTRRVLPLLEKYWPGIPDKFRQPVLRAIELAEQSASAEAPATGLHEAVVHSVITAGAALMAQSELTSKGGPKPKNTFEGTIASFVAKAAEHAAKAAEEAPEESAWLAFNAWRFARDAASMAEDGAVVFALDQVLTQIALPEGESDVEGSESEETPLVRRGRRLFLLAAAPLVVLELLTVAHGLSAGSDEINWWKAVVLPSFSFLILAFIWKGQNWPRWVLALRCLFSGGVALFVLGQLFLLLARAPTRRWGLVFGERAKPIWLLVLPGLLDLAVGLVLLAPSVRAFVRHRREMEDSTF